MNGDQFLPGERVWGLTSDLDIVRVLIVGQSFPPFVAITVEGLCGETLANRKFLFRSFKGAQFFVECFAQGLCNLEGD